MKISAHFQVEEFVSRSVFQRWREKSVWFLDPKIIALAEFLRMHFKAPILINTWHTGGDLQYRGFREPDCTVGAKLSQHRFGRAIDFNVQGVNPEEVRKEILFAQQLFIDIGLTTMEAGEFTPTWTHLDVRPLAGPIDYKPAKLVIVKP